MIREIYTRIPTDQNYKPRVETSDEIENILAQIRMMLGTKPGQILGSIDFGIDIERYVFAWDYNQDQIGQLITTTIHNNLVYDQKKYDVQAEVKFGKDYLNANDYCLIDITINQMKCLGIFVNQNE